MLLIKDAFESYRIRQGLTSTCVLVLQYQPHSLTPTYPSRGAVELHVPSVVSSHASTQARPWLARRFPGENVNVCEVRTWVGVVKQRGVLLNKSDQVFAVLATRATIASDVDQGAASPAGQLADTEYTCAIVCNR